MANGVLVCSLLLVSCPATEATPDAGQPDPQPQPRVDAGLPVDGGVPDSGMTAASDAGVAAFSCTGKAIRTVAIKVGEEQKLLDEVNILGDKSECVVFELAAGTFIFQNAITIRGKGVTLIGAGKGKKGEGEGVVAPGATASTVLRFADNAAANSNGVEFFSGELFTISNLAIWNAKKDALRVEGSKNVKIQKVRTEWAKENDPANGKYGIYPVKSENVLVEDCEAYRAADAGIYVGQTKYAILRRNIARENVAGIEVENTQFADVYENEATDNTCGLVVFDLPGNPVKGTDIRVHNNMVKNNNRANFASSSGVSSTVSQVPAGTGTFIMASRRVELFQNSYQKNNTVDVSVLSGLAIEPDPTKWAAGGLNFASSDVYVHDNVFSGDSGAAVDNGMLSPNRPLGLVLGSLYAFAAIATDAGVAQVPVEPFLFDGIGPMGQPDTTNEARVCFVQNMLGVGTANAIVNLNLGEVVPLLNPSPLADGGMLEPDPVSAYSKTSRYQQGIKPFNCAAFMPPVAAVVLP